MNIIEQKLRDYRPSTPAEQEVALVEIVQQLILFGLARTAFFAGAAFHGGTCLRILFGMRRFSEDLDFVLKAPADRFSWETYFPAILTECRAFGVELEIKDRKKTTGAVKSAFLKTDSIGKVLLAAIPFSRHSMRKIAIKLEIDTNPPPGSGFEARFLGFPGPAAVAVQDLSSGFSGKLHALLCRAYVKGRDWYDLLWYAERGAAPNLKLLGNAIQQTGPWKGRRVNINSAWIVEELQRKISGIDWGATQRDVARFVPAAEQAGLKLWSKAMFLDAVVRLRRSWEIR